MHKIHSSVQAHLFQAFEKVKLMEDASNCNYARCGRTDKGVSALGQVTIASYTAYFWTHCMLVSYSLLFLAKGSVTDCS